MNPIETLDRRDTPTWEREALCAQVDPELFFPEKGRADGVREAKKICARCPVKDKCLETALTIPASEDRYGGIWGGLTAKERMAERRRLEEQGIDLPARRKPRQCKNSHNMDDPRNAVLRGDGRYLRCRACRRQGEREKAHRQRAESAA